MNFVERRRRANRYSWFLVAAFVSILAVISGIVWGAVYFLFLARGTPENEVIQVATVAAVGIFLLIAAGAFVKWVRVGQRGGDVARMLNGREVSADSRDPLERRFYNIVEEMAIASGLPVPEVFVIPGDEINAFAAGLTPKLSAVAVTDGALRKLTRGELQGVVGHEFGHIFSGDTRLNMRLLALLGGLHFLIIAGALMARTRTYASSRNNVASLGLILIALGSLGYGLGHFLRLAVSRQREYMADDTAVRLTRNPTGIGRALQKIAVAGSEVASPHASSMQQFFIASSKTSIAGGESVERVEGIDEEDKDADIDADARAFQVRSQVESVFSTHPPLEKRINRLLPDWDGDFSPAVKSLRQASQNRVAAQKEESQGQSAKSAAAVATGVIIAGAAGALQKQIGERIMAPDEGDVSFAKDFLKGLDPQVYSATQSGSAPWLVVALLLEKRDGDKGMSLLRGLIKPERLAYIQQIRDHLKELTREQRLVVLAMAAPALQRMSPSQADQLRSLLLRLIVADGTIDFWEWLLTELASVQLPNYALRRASHSLEKSARRMLAFMAQIGEDPQGYTEACAQMGLRAGDIPQVDMDPTALSTDLDALSKAPDKYREKFLRAVVVCATNDGKIQPDEAAFLRGIAMRLDVPLPPTTFARQS